eukprot:scaffold667834_cov36-Prasinocladus_malaysianus.AAC.1
MVSSSGTLEAVAADLGAPGAKTGTRRGLVQAVKLSSAAADDAAACAASATLANTTGDPDPCWPANIGLKRATRHRFGQHTQLHSVCRALQRLSAVSRRT